MTFRSYTSYKDSGVEWMPMVPVDWNVKPLFVLASERKESNKGMIETNLLSLSYGRIVPKDINSNEGLLPESFETYQIVHTNDMVFRLTDLQNDKRSLRSAIVKEDGIITSAYTAVQPVNIQPDYLSSVLRAYDLQKVFYSMGDGLRQSMKYSDIKRLPIPVPPHDVQIKITKFLDRETSKLDTLIAKQECLIDLLKEKRQAVIAHAVIKGLNPDVPKKYSGVEWLGDVPAHWAVERFKRSILSSRNGVWGDESLEDENDIPCVRVADFDRQRLCVKLGEPTIRNILPKDLVGRQLSFGNLLLEKSGGGENQPVGCVVLYEDTKPAVCSNFIAKVELADGMVPSYWRYMHAAAYSVRLTVGSINQTSGIQNLDQGRYFDERACFPPYHEQQDIANYLDRETAKIDVLIKKSQESIKLAKEHRTALISAAVTGKIDVREAA